MYKDKVLNVARYFLVVCAMSYNLAVASVETQGANGMTSKSHSEIANVVETPSSAGYFLKTKDNTLYRIEEYILRGELGLNKLAGIKHVPINSQEDLDGLEFVINVSNGIDLQRLAPRFLAQSAAIVNPDFVKVLDVQAFQVEEDIFVVAASNIAVGDIITIADNNGVYAISLGEVANNLVDTLGTIDWPASEVTYSLEQALKSFPDNQELKDLLTVKNSKKHEEKFVKIFADIDEKYNDFQSAERQASKRVHADNVLHEIGYYEAVASELGLTEFDPRMVELKQEMEQFLAAPDVIALPELDASKLSSRVDYYKGSQFSGGSAGSGGVVAAVVAVGESDFLIRYTGLGNEYEGKVFRAHKEITNSSTNTYVAKTTEITGNLWNLFMHENDGWSASFATYPPGIQTKVDLYAVKGEEFSDSVDAIYGDYSGKSAEPAQAQPEVSDLQW